MPSPLFVDANVLLRCVVGRAAFVVDDLLSKGVRLATTEAQAREAERVLHGRFGLTEVDAAQELQHVTSVMELYLSPTYKTQEVAARARIHYKNKGDWPILAAAIEHEGAIWTDDRDFFGVGVPVWTTRNVGYVDGHE